MLHLTGSMWEAEGQRGGHLGVRHLCFESVHFGHLHELQGCLNYIYTSAVFCMKGAQEGQTDTGRVGHSETAWLAFVGLAALPDPCAERSLGCPVETLASRAAHEPAWAGKPASQSAAQRPGAQTRRGKARRCTAGSFGGTWTLRSSNKWRVPVDREALWVNWGYVCPGFLGPQGSSGRGTVPGRTSGVGAKHLKTEGGWSTAFRAMDSKSQNWRGPPAAVRCPQTGLS